MLNINKIKQDVEPIAKKYNIESVLLFGSYANECATEKSDTDFLVKFSVDVPSIFAVMGFADELKRKLNVNVDVVTLPLVRPDMLKIGMTVSVYERT